MQVLLLIIAYGFCTVGVTNMILHDKLGYKLTPFDNLMILLGPISLVLAAVLDFFMWILDYE